ncbi:GM13557 [Drosophila sechellia]|uniref:GM13557 n=1 Tax=Drosophila sechellia TaxID=7238 RepID=B4IM48_DROSE|nr:GM13557 [Drosophila sechellia]
MLTVGVSELGRVQGTSPVAVHKITMKDDQPVKQRYYPKNTKMQVEFVQKPVQLNNMDGSIPWAIFGSSSFPFGFYPRPRHRLLVPPGASHLDRADRMAYVRLLNFLCTLVGLVWSRSKNYF